MERQFTKMLYKGENIQKGMIIPVMNNTFYFVIIVNIPYRNLDALISYRTMAKIYNIETSRCIACIPYDEDDWEICRENVLRV